MDPRTFEQTAVSPELFGNAAVFLTPGATLSVNFTDDGQPISGARTILSTLGVASCSPALLLLVSSNAGSTTTHIQWRWKPYMTAAIHVQAAPAFYPTRLVQRMQGMNTCLAQHLLWVPSLTAFVLIAE